MSPACRRNLAVLVVLHASLSTALGQAEPPALRVTPTEIVLAPESAPRGVLQCEATRDVVRGATIVVLDASGSALWTESAPPATGTMAWIPVPLPDAGQVGRVVLRLVEDGRSTDFPVDYRRPDLGWSMHFIPGFHYDPVWWNTQANYCEAGALLDSHVGPGLELVEEYLAMCAADPDYKVALHQLPYLKTFLEARPAQVAELRARIATGQVAIVGGSHDEMQSTLISAEATARNAIYGTVFQRDVLSGDGRVAWQCDVFGHDPSFPSIMARTGHDAVAFARGPFHQWGIPRDLVNFPSEFTWMAPDGRTLLAHYMSGHYGYAYARFAAGANRAPDGERSRAIVAEMFEDLRRCALTRQVMLPMHTDFIRPLANLGDLVRDWNRHHLAPRALISTPRAFFDAVRAECQERDIVPPVITRDMNPIYTGCGVSFADLKLANRAVETALRDAEVWATGAWLTGRAYPWGAFDRAWRQLMFLAHHDGITGSMSDQVYVDMLAVVRDAHDTALRERDAALEFIAGRVAPGAGGAGPIGSEARRLAFNSLATPRGGVALDPQGDRRRVTEVAGVGWGPVVSGPDAAAGASALLASRGTTTLENEWMRVVVDLERGGTIAALVDKRTGAELLHGPGNDLVVYEEYASLPGQGEGPWHLATTGAHRHATGVRAVLDPPDAARPHRLVMRSRHPWFTAVQSLELTPGSRRLECETTILDWTGRDRLVRVEFPLNDVELPVHGLAASVIARPFSRTVDAAVDPWSLDQQCGAWIDTVATCAVVIGDAQDSTRHPIGVGEIVIDDLARGATVHRAASLAEALVKAGVTTTTTRRSARRHGDLALDSHVPDFRIWSGVGPDGAVIERLEWRRSKGELRALLVPDDEAGVAEIVADLRQHHRIRVGSPPAEDRRSAGGVAFLNRGTVSVNVLEDGTVGLNLMRSSTGWPAGVWIDPPTRRLPDGAPFETMHGSHRFCYAIELHAGDFRVAELAHAAMDYNHPLLARVAEGSDGTLPEAGGFLDVSPRTVLLTAMKPAGLAAAGWRAQAPAGPTKRVVVRLWNGSGKPTEAVVRPRDVILAAWRSDLLENEIEALAHGAAGVRLTLAENAYETLLIDLKSDVLAESEPPSTQELQPSAYWLLNLGEGVTGNGRVSLVPARRDLDFTSGAATIGVTVVNNSQDETITIDLDVVVAPDVDALLRPDVVVLRPNETREVTLDLQRQAGAPVSSSVVTLLGRCTEGSGGGPAVTVSAAVTLGDGPDANLRNLVTVENGAPIVGSNGVLSARLVNKTSGPIYGRAEWIMPFVNWSASAAVVSDVTIPPGGSVVIEAPLAGALPSWAMVRFGFASHVVYGEAVAVVDDPGAIVAGFGVDRVRLKASGTAEVSVRAVSLRGLEGDVATRLVLPADWSATSIGKSTSTISGATVIDATFAVAAAAGAPLRGTLAAEVGSTVVETPYSIAQEQRAVMSADQVVVDADLAEWSDAEFTQASSPLGAARCAVRFGAGAIAMAFEVEDDRHVQTKSGAAIWEGDSVQFALSPTPSTSSGYGLKDLEYGLAFCESGPLLWCWYGGDRGRTGRVDDAQVAFRRDGERSIYELSIPRAVFNAVPLDPGAVLGFCWIVNDDDGTGHRGAIQWTSGMSGGKDSSLFGELLLLP